MRAILVSCIAVGVCTACSKNADPTAVAYWVDRLEEPAQRTDAIRELGALGKPEAVAEVLRWFQEEGDWQPTAAYALGKLGAKEAVPQLIAGIDYAAGTGRDRTTRNKNRTNRNIARALAILKAPEAVAPLTRLLGTPEPKTRETVIRALGDLGDEAAVEPLTELAENDPEPFLRKVAVQALGTLGSPKAADTLVKMLFVEVPGISFYNEARYALLQIGAPVVPVMLQTLQRKNKTVEAIRQPDGSPLAEGAIEAKAGYVLGGLGAQEAKTPMLAALTRLFSRFEKRESVPVYASVPGAIIELCYALANLGGSADVVKALERVARTAEPNVRKGATDALTYLGARSATHSLLAAARKGPEAARRGAVQALSRLAEGQKLASYDALARAGGGEVAAQAMATMVEQERPRLVAAGECGRDAACWARKATDTGSPHRVRERGAFELGWLEAEEQIPALLKAAEDDDAEVRMAAVVSLRRFDGVDVEALQSIHDTWKKKIAYAGVNQELRNLIARRKSEKR